MGAEAVLPVAWIGHPGRADLLVLSYGTASGTNPFVALGSFFVSTYGLDIGPVFTTFLFQLSFATTATTIVSGAIAER